MDDLKKLVHTRYYKYEEIIKACNLVAEYIVKNKLVVYGGQAIDNSLRIYSKKIYEDYLIPDYDFYSVNNVHHAYEIFKLMCNHFEQVGVMPAFHGTTMKVRVFNDMVADSSYIKPDFYRLYKQTAIKYKGMYSRHPYLQYADQCRALSYPYENEGMEVVMHRWIKDYERMKLLYSKYPIGIGNEITERFLKKIKYPNSTVILTTQFLSKSTKKSRIESGLICGLEAVRIYELEFLKLIGDVIDTDEINNELPNIGYTSSISDEPPLIDHDCYVVELDHAEKIKQDAAGKEKVIEKKLPDHKIPKSYILEKSKMEIILAEHKINYQMINGQKVVSFPFLIIYLYAHMMDNYKVEGVDKINSSTIYMSAYFKMLIIMNIIFRLDFHDQFKIFYPSVDVIGEEKMDPIQKLFATDRELARKVKPPSVYYKGEIDKDQVFKEIPDKFEYDPNYYDV